MMIRIVSLFMTLGLCARIASADPASTQPATAPSTQPTASQSPLQKLAEKVEALAADVAGEDPTSPPATQPAAKPTPTTAPAQAQKFPTPAELIEKMKQIRQKEANLSKVAYFDLDGPIGEKPADFSWFGADNTLTLRTLLSRMHKARDDKDVRAVLITLGAGSSFNMAQAQEIRDALADLRRAGKKTFVYADSYDTSAYMLASGATNICMLAGGEIMIPGVGIETMYYKGTFDKVGVLADYVQIGEYKGAEEPYTRTAASDELRGELTHLIDSMYEQVVDGISLSRSISRQRVQELIDDTIVTGAVAKERGFVDHLVDQDGLRSLIKDELGNDIDLVRDYGSPKRESVDFSNPFALFASLAKKPEPSNKPAIAIIYAEGVITDGEGQGGMFSESGIGSESMRRAFRVAVRDENVKAVVLRIDSPGGSALASEVMWQAMRRLAQEKPVIVSVGSMAASGGYYLASAGDYIFADPVGIVGSIGVVGGKFVMKDLYEKVGLTTETYSKGRNAGLFSSNQPFSDRQRRMVRNWMQQTYDQFTQRVMTTRRGKIQDIDKVARGRIFVAEQAKQLGMVDELGGLDAAVAYAADQADLAKGKYDTRILPAPRTLADYFGGGAADDDNFDADSKLPSLAPKMTINADSVLRLMPSPTRKLLEQQIWMSQLLEKRPVVLMSPFVVTQN